jgi:hypothetical protein
VQDDASVAKGAAGVATGYDPDGKAAGTNELGYRCTGNRHEFAAHVVDERKEVRREFEKGLVEPGDVHHEIYAIDTSRHVGYRRRHDDDLVAVQRKYLLNFVTRSATRRDEHRARRDGASQLFDALIRA